MDGDDSSHLFSIIAKYLRKRGFVKTLATFLNESQVIMNGGDAFKRHKEMQCQQHGLDGTVTHKKKQMKGTDNAGHSTTALEDFERGESNVETERSSKGKQKHSKKKNRKMDESATDEKWHEEAETTEEKQNQNKKEADGSSNEVNIAVEVDSFELKEKIQFVGTKNSKKKLCENDKDEDNNFEKRKKSNKKAIKSGVDVQQEGFSQIGQLHADSTTQEAVCASHDRSIPLVEAGEIQHTGALDSDATLNKSKKTGKTKKKHGGEEMACYITLQDFGSKKLHDLESLQSLKNKELLEEDRIFTKKQKLSIEREQNVSKPVSQGTVSKVTNDTNANSENQAMAEIRSESKSAIQRDSSLQPNESTIQNAIIETRMQKRVERDGAITEVKKHRKKASAKPVNSTDKPESIEVLTEVPEAEASTKLVGNLGMVEFEDDCVLSAKKEKKTKEGGKRKKATEETETAEVTVASAAANGNFITAVKETEHSMEDIEKGRGEVADAFLGQPEATAVKTKQQKDASSKSNKVQYSDLRLKDNSYWAKGGADQGYGAKAQEQLELVRGRDFRHEKTKKKRGSYRGGLIDLQSHSIKFDHSDED